MCGIVGLLLKKPALHEQLGALMTPMLVGMTSRGPDSAGVAIFGERQQQARKFSLFWSSGAADWNRLRNDLDAAFAGRYELDDTGRHAVLVTAAAPGEMRQWLGEIAPQVYVLSVGHCIDLYKDIGAPADIVRRYALDAGFTDISVLPIENFDLWRFYLLTTD